MNCIYHNIIHFYAAKLNRKIIFYTSRKNIQEIVDEHIFNHNLLDKNAKNPSFAKNFNFIKPELLFFSKEMLFNNKINAPRHSLQKTDFNIVHLY